MKGLMRLRLPELLFIFLLFVSYSFVDQTDVNQASEKIDLNKTEQNGFWNYHKSKADSVLSTLSLDEKIGQLFMVAAYSNKDETHYTEIENLVKNQKIGGLIFFQGTPQKQIELLNRYQASSQIPLMIGMDAEWGIRMRLKKEPGFPRQMTLGAIRDEEVIYEMGKMIGEHCKRIGVHVNFAPVVDVNVNPKNPVINDRSFGEDKYNVAQKAWMYAKGMEDVGVMSCVKHFPGHGDTDSDSHKSLPTINHDYNRLKDIELYPFRELFNKGVGSVMVAHLNIPSLGTKEGEASTLTKAIATSLLRDSLGYKGLAFTDALNMKGVSAYFKPGEVDLRAFKAGNDVLLFPEDVPTAINMIKTAVENGDVSQEELDDKVRRILQAKFHYGVFDFEPLSTENLKRDLFTPDFYKLEEKIFESSITCLRNEDNQLPISNAGNKRIGVVFIGEENQAFKKNLKDFVNYTWFFAPKDLADNDKFRTFYLLSEFDQVIVHYGGTSSRVSKDFGMTKKALALVDKLAGKVPTVFIWNGNPYALEQVKKIDKLESVVLSYSEDAEQQKILVESLIGARSISGKLPVSAGGFKAGDGLVIKKNGDFLLKTRPEKLGVNSIKLQRIDSIVNAGIEDMAMPGCQVVVTKDGKVLWEKSYGYLSYDKKVKVQNFHIYDLASLTKILSTTISLMKLYDQGLIDLDNTLGDYLDYIPEDSPYHKVKIRDVLWHQARFQPWIPYYKDFLENDSLYAKSFKKSQDLDFKIRVAEDMYCMDTIKTWMRKRILAEPFRNKKEYKYSDLGFYMLADIIEKQVGERLDYFVKNTFYKPMDLYTMGYLPLNKHGQNKIVPTEYDADFRKQLLQGDVHDQGAALQGGVSGHAGLFANAKDVAAVMQMLLDGGVYQGKRYLQRGTIELFTQSKSPDDKENRRGLGFDKPQKEGDPGPCFDGISEKSFGHSGFTGTFCWADPEEDLVYVFLSNRVYPSSENRKLIKSNLRSELQHIIYQAIDSKDY